MNETGWFVVGFSCSLCHHPISENNVNKSLQDCSPWCDLQIDLSISYLVPNPPASRARPKQASRNVKNITDLSLKVTAILSKTAPNYLLSTFSSFSLVFVYIYPARRTHAVEAQYLKHLMFAPPVLECDLKRTSVVCTPWFYMWNGRGGGARFYLPVWWNLKAS